MAIRAGKLLADRLFGGSDITMDYDKVDFYIYGMKLFLSAKMRIAVLLVPQAWKPRFAHCSNCVMNKRTPSLERSHKN